MMALLCLPPSTRLDAKKRDYERFWNFTTFHSCLNQNKNRKENIEFNAVDSLGRTRFMKACIMGSQLSFLQYKLQLLKTKL